MFALGVGDVFLYGDVIDTHRQRGDRLSVGVERELACVLAAHLGELDGRACQSRYIQCSCNLGNSVERHINLLFSLIFRARGEQHWADEHCQCKFY